MADWTTTVRQVLPRFFAVARRMRPSFHRSCLLDLSAEFLEQQGVGLIIWDVDGTLMPWHGAQVDPELRPGWDRLRAMPELEHMILSNCSDRRFVELGQIFPDVPVVKGYTTPKGAAARRIFQGVETWSDGDHWDPLTQADVTTLRKPDARLVHFALGFAGDLPASRALMVGDQYFTDIAGANEAGVRTLKVRTWQRGSFPWPVGCMQWLETILYRVCYGPAVDSHSGSHSGDRTGDGTGDDA